MTEVVKETTIVTYQWYNDYTFSAEYVVHVHPEDGSFSIPARTTLVKPPKATKTKVPVWNPDLETWELTTK